MKSRRKKKANRTKTTKPQSVDYQQLEDRKLLAVDVGVQFDASELDVNTVDTQAALQGDVGLNHIVEFLNDSYRVYDRDTGAVLQQSTLLEFWADTGANFAFDANFSDPRIVYDASTDRWFTTTFEPADGGAFVDGEFFLAISVSGDPTDGWRSVQFNASPAPISLERTSTLSVDGDAVYVGVDVTSISGPNSSIFAFAKQDLLGAFPTAANVTVFDELDNDEYGEQIQIARGSSDIDGRASGIAAFVGGGNVLSKVDLVGDLAGGGNVTITRTDVTVPTYLAAPNARQPGGALSLVANPPLITSAAYSARGFLWAVHTVQGSAGNNSAIRWYQINESTSQLVNTGTIDNPDFDFIAPSIAVNQFGTGVSIGFTATGETLAPSAFTSHAFVNYATNGAPDVEFSFPSQLLQQGLDAFQRPDDTTGQNFFAQFSSTVVDPRDQFAFWNFSQYSVDNNTWRTHIAEAGIFDISPTIQGNAQDNVIVLRQSDQDDNYIEIIVDGSLENVYEMTAIDELIVLGGDGDDLFVIDQTFGEIFAEELIEIFGGAGDDTIRYVDGLDHNFNINGNGTGVVDNTIQFFELENIIGSSGNDTFNIGTTASDWTIEAGAGDDLIVVAPSATGMLELFGQAGDDTYQIPLANVPNIFIEDSIDSEFDRVIGFGGEQNNVITIDGALITIDGIDVSGLAVYVGIESTDIDATGGDDEFRILSTLESGTISGGDGNDVFIVSSDAPGVAGSTSGILGELTLDGGDGVSRLIVSNFGGVPTNTVITDTQIIGATASPITYRGEFSTQAGQAGITIYGSDSGRDTFDIRSLTATNSLEVLGAGGNDVFTVRRAARGRIELDGQQGVDTYRAASASAARTILIQDSGTELSDRLALSFSDQFEDFLISNEQINSFGEFFIWDENIEVVVVDTRGGNDAIRIGNTDSRFVRLDLGDGNDEVTVLNTAGITGLKVDGGFGNDDFEIRGGQFDTFIQVFGENGNDEFDVAASSLSSIRADGGNGNDSVVVDYARRASRRVDARDSGDGNDTLVVNGTDFIDRVNLLSSAVVRSGEAVVYDSSTESLTLDTAATTDIVNIFGLAAADTSVLLRNGSDILNINSTTVASSQPVNLVVDLGNGNDNTSIRSIAEESNVSIFGQSGSDFFSVGSTIGQDNGNLGLFRGELRLAGGTGADTVYLNDNGVSTGYSYFLNDSVLANLNGPNSLARPQFEAIRFNDIERVRFDASQGDNFISLAESTTTEFIVDGNGAADFLFLNGDINNRELTAGAESGRFRFFDGSRDVTFVGFSGFSSGRNS